ncbi:MAG: HAMP domain-containing sensor histidine kinase [Thermomicrobiales bacterium]
MTIRLRLTLLYAGLFLLAGSALLIGMYRLTIHALDLPEMQARIERQRAENPNGPQYRTLEAQIAERERALQVVRNQMWRALVIVTGGAALLGWFVAWRVLRPIRQIADTAQRASASTLSERLDLRGPPDELHRLAATFDDMLDRLQAAFETQRRFAGEVSHELRTPLATMRAAADVARANPAAAPSEQELAATVRAAVDRSAHLIDRLLVLARSESTMLDRVPVDLADIAGESLAHAARPAGEAGVVIIDAPLDPAPISGDPVLLERLCDNLIENAIRYNTHDGHGWLRVTTGQSPAPVLRVENNGPRIPEAEVERLFAPFQRGARGDASPAPPGTGLGLAIVRSVAASHGGTVSAEARPEGGLSISVTFPPASSLHS